MNVDLKKLKRAIDKVNEKHRGPLKGKSGRSDDFEEGFTRGLDYVRNYMIPAFETIELDEASAVEASMESELDDLKSKIRFGLATDEDLR